MRVEPLIMIPSPLLRYAADTLLADPGRPVAASGMAVAAFTTLGTWLADIDRQTAVMRPRSLLYQRFDRTARSLTRGRIRACDDAAAMSELVRRLRASRRPSGLDVHGLDRVCLSANVLRRRCCDVPFLGCDQPWLLDSGAFTQVALQGGFSQSPRAYAAMIRLYAPTGLIAASTQDYMCEPVALKATGLSIARH